MAKKKKTSTQAIPAPDKDWQAENDADTLIRSKEIMADSSRRKAAEMVLRDKSSAINSAVKECSGGMKEYIKKAK